MTEREALREAAEAVLDAWSRTEQPGWGPRLWDALDALRAALSPGPEPVAATAQDIERALGRSIWPASSPGPEPERDFGRWVHGEAVYVASPGLPMTEPGGVGTGTRFDAKQLRSLRRIAREAQATYVGRHWPSMEDMRVDGIGYGLVEDRDHERFIRRYIDTFQPEFMLALLAEFQRCQRDTP